MKTVEAPTETVQAPLGIVQAPLGIVQAPMDLLCLHQGLDHIHLGLLRIHRGLHRPLRCLLRIQLGLDRIQEGLNCFYRGLNDFHRGLDCFHLGPWQILLGANGFEAGLSSREPLPGDFHIHKSFNSAFESTELLPELDRLGVARIRLAGAATNWCIRATAHGALDRGFDVTLISDAHTTRDLELEPGRVVEARSVIDDLNVAMRWLAYPGRSNAAVPAAEVAFV